MRLAANRPLATALAAAALAACQSDPPAPVAKPDDKGGEATLFEAPPAQRDQLKVVTVAHKAFVRPLIAPSLVSFDELKTSDVTPLVSGKVSKLLVNEGDRVTAGQPLMLIASPDSSDNTTNLTRDRSALATKEAVLARDTDLFAHKAISLEELEAARNDVVAAKAAVQDDEAHVSITGGGQGGAVLRSPIAGVVVHRAVTPGVVVQAGATVSFTITDPTAVWVVSQLYQEDLRRVEIGDAAVIRSPVLDAPLAGKVIYIGASIDPDSLTIPVRVAAQNPGGLLKKGMYVDAAIMPARGEDAIQVPLASLLRDADNLPFVYVQAAPGKFARRHIELGAQLPDGYVVHGGLKDGDQVLADGAVFIQFADSLER
ncbi:MAG TPA: efflux RND transporter periplasmic adaptor subunit [Kofleriaceae bacterium]|jgi:cobalt-zinc-cadmium efflux system membrane fusion protein|nr:efflux RND transporter periplasmic adaptor subunit [Kofleriaceae bacterium]